jgi:hypothetical protein
MKPAIRTAYSAEMEQFRAARGADDLDRAFAHLERAHILGQRYFFPHLQTHLAMLEIGQRRRDGREVRGQIARIAAVFPGYAFGWIPKGNTGGANVSAMKPMAPPADLAAMLSDYSVGRDVMGRALIWGAIAVAAYVAIGLE